MKLKQFIKELQEMQQYIGKDVEVVLSSDSEGNSYSTIDSQSLLYIYCGEDKFIDAASHVSFNHEDIKRFCTRDRISGVCIYPFRENYKSAEDATNWRKLEEEKELTHKIAQAENQLDTMKEEGRL